MPDDDLSVFLSGALHAFENKERRHGSIDAKISSLAMIRLGVEALHHVNQQINGATQHPAAAACEPLLSAPMGEARQRIAELAAQASDREFQQFCESFADYGASLSDRNDRKRASMMMYALGAARSAAGQQSFQGQGQQYQPPQQHYQPVYQQQPYQQPPPQLEPPNPNEPLFKQYMDLGPSDGSKKIRAVFSAFTQHQAREFFKLFLDYASTVKDPQKRMTSIALSNTIAIIYHENFSNSRLSLAAPERRS